MIKISKTNPNKKPNFVLKILGFVAIVLLMAEIALRMIGHAGCPSKYRGSELDERGFPNPKGIKKADVITYGSSINAPKMNSKFESWPQKFQRMGQNEVVYNMSKPGQRLVDAYFHLNEMLSLNPKTIFINLDFKEDFIQTYQAAYYGNGLERFKELDTQRLKDFDALDRATKSFLNYTESSQKVESFEDSVMKNKCYPNDCRYVRFLNKHCALYRAIKMSWNLIENKPEGKDWRGKWEHAVAEVKSHNSSHFHLLETKNVKQLFYPVKHQIALDVQDPRIMEGYRITQEILSDIQKRLEKENIRLVVNLVPTKEFSYLPLLQAEQVSLDQEYKSVIDNENSLKNKMIDFMKTAQILYVDLVPEFQKALLSGKNIYTFFDKHAYTEESQVILAETIYEGFSKAVERVQQNKLAKEGWEYSNFKDRNKDFELKLMTAVAILSFVLILIFTRTRQTIRPVLLLCLYGFYILYQCIFMIEFFPLTAFQMFSYIEEKTVFYDKLVPIRQDGKLVTQLDYEVLPMLADGRSKRYVDDALKNSEIANEFATAYARAYDKKFRKPGEPGIAEIRFERWKWNVIQEPNDPLKGFVAKRVIGKPYEDPSDV